jgi:hypothetical protein
LGQDLITSATLEPQVKKESRYCNELGRGCEYPSRRLTCHVYLSLVPSPLQEPEAEP